MVLDKDITVKIGDKEYKLCFTVRAIFETERMLPGGNLTKAVAQQPFPVEVMFILLKQGIRGGGVRITDEEAEPLFLQAVEDVGFVGLSMLLVAAIGKSGILGKVKNQPAAEA